MASRSITLESLWIDPILLSPPEVPLLNNHKPFAQNSPIGWMSHIDPSDPDFKVTRYGLHRLQKAWRQARNPRLGNHPALRAGGYKVMASSSHISFYLQRSCNRAPATRTSSTDEDSRREEGMCV